MNFKERGITVGDLTILIIDILVTTFIFKTLKSDNNTSYYIPKLELLAHKNF